MFEYIVETKTLSNLSTDLAKYLNERGKERWELIHYENKNSDSWISESCKLIFKRQIIIINNC